MNSSIKRRGNNEDLKASNQPITLALHVKVTGLFYLQVFSLGDKLIFKSKEIRGVINDVWQQVI